MLQKEHLKLNAVLDLEIEDSLLVRRVLGRLIHPPSGRTYHEEFRPPKVPMTDDVCIMFRDHRTYLVAYWRTSC